MKKLNLITLRIISALLAMVLMVSVSIITVGAETYATNNEINAVYNYSDENAYTLYKEKHSGVKYADTDIVLQGGTEA